MNRRDIETLEHDFDGAAQLRARATVTDAGEMRADHIAGAYPKADIDVGAFLSVGLFDPDSPLRGEVGAALSAEALLMPGLALSGQVRVPVAGNLEDAVRESDSVLPHVRSDSVLYDRDGAIEISHLTAEHLFRPGRAIFGRVSAGYLERMYGGVSGELLWQPATSPLGLGVELNYARQRDYAGLLGFRDYDVVTGHASSYYSLGGGYRAQLDLGRYLAGDWGATFTLERSFANGWRVGGFFTLTDVSFDDFGEGSFDKGIQLRIPVSWLTGEPSRGGFATTLRPVTRDGGARLEVRNRLYDVVRRDLGTEFDAGWTRVWR